MIYRKEEYVQHDENDREFPIKQIDRLEGVDGGGVRFIGRAVLNMQTPLGIQQLPVSFEVQADSIRDAFARYAEYARPQIEEVRSRIQQRIEQLRQGEESRIITPGQAAPDSGSIIHFEDFRSES